MIRDIKNHRPISFLNLDYKIYTTTLNEELNQKTDTIIGKSHSEVIKNRILLHTYSTICYIKDVSNKLNKNLSQ